MDIDNLNVIVLGGESVHTSKMGHSDTVALILQTTAMKHKHLRLCLIGSCQ